MEIKEIEEIEVEEKINVDIKTGIINTIAKNIYHNHVLKVREAIANSMDNSADTFLINIDENTNSISLFDNGNGISKTKILEIFRSIGHGINKDDKSFNSYFGLGLMSIVELGKEVNIITKSIHTSEVIKVHIDSESIFCKEMEDKPIESLTEFVTLSNFNSLNREFESALSDDIIKNIFGGVFPESFTEIIINEINKEVFEKINTTDFIEDIKKIAPLEIDPKEKFVDSIKEIKYHEIINLLRNREYCPTINLYIKRSINSVPTRIYKYFPQFKTNLSFRDEDVIVGYSESGNFSYYCLCSVGDLEEEGKGFKETGFWVRNKNFLVKEADFLQKPGTKDKKIIDQPLQKWIYGEIFHKNMNDFLDVTRNEFSLKSSDYNQFYNEVYSIFKGFNVKLRKAYYNSKEILDAVYEPFNDMKKPQKNPFGKAEKNLKKIINVKSMDDVLQKFGKNRDLSIENDNLRIDKLLTEKGVPIILADNDKVKVVIDPTCEEKNQYRENSSERVIINLPANLFESQRIIFFGRAFEVFYVAGETNNKQSVSINDVERKIYINPFSTDIMNYSISFIEVYLIVEYAYIYSSDRPQMKELILKLLVNDKKLKSSELYENLGEALLPKKRR